ncbi:MAG TPA: hypothetical protein VMM76_01165 [Pirellulaceae bacterium]|nr:hypothetical protein [Pirellulaceae bacterium]
MKLSLALVSVLTVASAVSAGETLFTSAPQEFGGRKYYWLAEWKLEVTLPDDVAVDDRLEVLFGSKGPDKRTLSFQYDAQQGSLAEVAQQPYQWIEVPLKILDRFASANSLGRKPLHNWKASP